LFPDLDGLAKQVTDPLYTLKREKVLMD